MEHVKNSFVMKFRFQVDSCCFPFFSRTSRLRMKVSGWKVAGTAYISKYITSQCPQLSSIQLTAYVQMGAVFEKFQTNLVIPKRTQCIVFCWTSPCVREECMHYSFKIFRMFTFSSVCTHNLHICSGGAMQSPLCSSLEKMMAKWKSNKTKSVCVCLFFSGRKSYC